MRKEDKTHVWFCSSDPGFIDVMARALGESFELSGGAGLAGAELGHGMNGADVLLLDLRGAEQGLDAGLAWMAEASRQPLPPPMVAMLEAGDRAGIFKVMEHGAFDTVTAPPNVAELRIVLQRARKYAETQKQLTQLRSPERSVGRLQELIGASDSMQQVFALARRVAPCDVSVLITGETGTGKELLARAMHQLGPRSGAPFVGFSCAALPETLVEDELFGHERGAFTGALMARRGRFEAADQGTLFLDEIGDLPLALQVKLLRVLQARAFERLGSNAQVSVNIRLICATHCNLSEMVKQGNFREDLFYRLNVVQLHLPPLRERRDDVLFLAQHFLQLFAQQFGKKVARFSRLALHALEEHNWPGNVRELENVVQRAVVLAEGATIELWHLPTTMRQGFEQPRVVHSYDEAVRDFKRRLILRTLRECNWRKAETARTLGMARGYLHRLINQLQIAAEPRVEPVVEPEPTPLPVERIM